MKRSITLLVPVLAIALAACSSASPSASTSAAPTPTPTTAATPSPAPSASAAAMGKDIVETATEAGSFSTLLTAATAAGLVETLQGEGPYTVFAPTDAAFAALRRARSTSSSPTRRHSRRSCFTTSSRGPYLPTRSSDHVGGLVEGSPIAIAVKDGTVYLNDSAKVVTPDVMASNGVIHVIDTVLLPPAD